MKNKEILQIMSAALDKHGELILATDDKEKILINTVIDTIVSKDMIFPLLLQAMTKAGSVLEADEEQGIAIAVIPAGRMNASRAFVVAKCEESTAVIAAYFQEGLIKQYGASQAIEKLKHLC